MISIRYVCQDCDDYIWNFTSAFSHQQRYPDHTIDTDIDEDELRQYMVSHGLFDPAAEDE